MCAECPVLEHCRVWAVHDITMTHGFVGGMTESERIVARLNIIGESSEQ